MANRRIRLCISYDGTAYAGWQRQANAMSVQQRLEETLALLIGVPTVTHGASRTDAGVHALGQVAHFDTSASIPPEKYSFALNTHLPEDIRVTASEEAPADFHARFDAHGKVYRYCIHNQRHASAAYRNLRAHVPLTLDAARMDAEAQTMVGTYDFAAFAAAGSVAKGTVRTIQRVQVRRHGDLIVLVVQGNAFLYNMVRILVGTLMDVGLGRVPEGVLQRGIDSGDRLTLGITAPAQGLTLMRVFYADDWSQADAYFDPAIYLLQ